MNSGIWYRLREDKTPVACNIEDIDPGVNSIANTELIINKEEVRVSTVFLNIDHNHGRGAPILFETMIFGGKHDGYQERYYTYNEAISNHYAVVDKLNGLNSGIEL